jgi:hypothetical protein
LEPNKPKPGLEHLRLRQPRYQAMWKRTVRSGAFGYEANLIPLPLSE